MQQCISRTDGVVDRRGFLLGGGLAAASLVMPGCRSGGSTQAGIGGTGVVPPYADDLRDRCWMWGHDSGTFDGPGNEYKIPASEPISMVEACRYMGVPNVCAIVSHKTDEGYLAPFRGMKRVSWMMCGRARKYHEQLVEPNFVRLFQMDNLTGFDLDDFFLIKDAAQPQEQVSWKENGRKLMVVPGSMTLGELENIKTRMVNTGRTLDLRLVVYAHQLRPECAPAFERVDTVMLWTWDGADIGKLEANWRSYRSICPVKPTLLGIYMWDFGGCKPIEPQDMRMQLSFARDLFLRGEIEGLVFHCTPLVNKGLEAVEICRGWLAENATLTCGERRRSVL